MAFLIYSPPNLRLLTARRRGLFKLVTVSVAGFFYSKTLRWAWITAAPSSLRVLGREETVRSSQTFRSSAAAEARRRCREPREGDEVHLFFSYLFVDLLLRLAPPLSCLFSSRCSRGIIFVPTRPVAWCFLLLFVGLVAIPTHLLRLGNRSWGPGVGRKLRPRSGQSWLCSSMHLDHCNMEGLDFWESGKYPMRVERSNASGEKSYTLEGRKNVSYRRRGWMPLDFLIFKIIFSGFFCGESRNHCHSSDLFISFVRLLSLYMYPPFRLYKRRACQSFIFVNFLCPFSPFDDSREGEWGSLL